MPSAYPMFHGLMIAVPHTGRPLVPQWTYSYSNCHAPMCFNVVHAVTYKQRVDAARNYFIEEAFKNNIKYVFFIDEDVTFEGHALRQLIYRMDHHPEAAVVGGIYCHKSPPPMPMIFRGFGAGPYWDWKLGEFFEVDGISMGLTLVRVEAFRNLEKPWFRTVDDIDKFLDGDPKAEMWTEDLYACAKLKEAGWKIFADAAVIGRHWNMDTGEPVDLPPDCFPLRKAEVKKGDKKIVDLGCGETKYECEEGEVLTVDIRDEVKPDYRCDLGRLPFKTGEFDIVFSSHTLEHFARNQVDEVLDEWIRILKPDGEFRLVLPNIEWAADQIKQGAMNDDVLNVLYGAQTYEQNFHKFCFTPVVLQQLLTARGFKRIDIELKGYNIYARAWRVPPDEAKVPKLGAPPASVKTKARNNGKSKNNGHSKRGKKLVKSK